MGTLGRFFDWLLGILNRAVAALSSFVGMIVTAVTSAIALVGGLFARFSWLNDATQKINEAAAYVSDVVQFAEHPFVSIIYNAVALDRAVQLAAFLFTATVGVAVLMFVTVFVAFMSLVPLVLVVKAVARAIKTGSLGFIEP